MSGFEADQTEHLSHWWPATYDFGLIQAPCKTAAKVFADAVSAEGLTLEASQIEAPLGELLSRLLPFRRPYTKRLFVETSFGWTAYFTNGGDGSDAFPAMSFLTRTLDVTSMRICASPDGVLYPAVIWEVYGAASKPDNPVGCVRSIAAANDGGRWVYEESGEPFEFEDSEAKLAKRKKDRFTVEMLRGYLYEFGIPELNDAWFAPRGMARAVLLEQPDHGTGRVLNLEEAKAWLMR